jgi:hypothetical protein
MEKFTCFLLYNFMVPCHFNLIHLLLHNYIMCVCLKLEAVQYFSTALWLLDFPSYGAPHGLDL